MYVYINLDTKQAIFFTESYVFYGGGFFISFNKYTFFLFF
jgi:hypothetical protein